MASATGSHVDGHARRHHKNDRTTRSSQRHGSYRRRWSTSRHPDPTSRRPALRDRRPELPDRRPELPDRRPELRAFHPAQRRAVAYRIPRTQARASRATRSSAKIEFPADQARLHTHASTFARQERATSLLGPDHGFLVEDPPRTTAISFAPFSTPNSKYGEVGVLANGVLARGSQVRMPLGQTLALVEGTAGEQLRASPADRVERQRRREHMDALEAPPSASS